MSKLKNKFVYTTNLKGHVSKIQSTFGTKFQGLKHQLDNFRPYNLGQIAIKSLTPKKGYRVKSNIAYGLKSRQRLDLYISDQSANKPLILFVHGGAWSRGDKSEYGFVGEAFTRYGYDVAIVNYHLAPEHKFPHYVDDLVLALHFLHDHQQELQISTDQIALMGHSAGAFNIASLLYHPKLYDLKIKDNIKAMVGIAGPYHFDYKGDVLAEHAFELDTPYNQVMPYYFVEHNHIRHFLLLAENDKIVGKNNSIDLKSALLSAGNHCELMIIPKTGHITIMGSVSSLFSRFFKTRSVILDALNQSFNS
ncbi:alpha/beta hydrolase [Acinetobacter sp. 194]|uniref:alpha/beta hydrolase n=1 Tax=Acinetobacter shaoyimingii TaxID=2715164 RepID=UPI00140AF7CA|nr:alpha/beta hydrolase [Acinetobacter shaoyimingii]NHB57825.1 alpha/beta hydrolase [Acinetobacter shaoyimingii]